MSTCTTCAHVLNKGCCNLLPDEAPYKFGLSASDLRRVSKATGLPPRTWAVKETITFGVKRSMEDMHPGIGRQFPKHWRIALKFEGDGLPCYFLDPQTGCRLSREVRPRTCVIYPHWYDVEDTGDIRMTWGALATPGRCLVLSTADKATEQRKLLGTTLPEIMHYARLSNQELAKNSETDLMEAFDGK